MMKIYYLYLFIHFSLQKQTHFIHLCLHKSVCERESERVRVARKNLRKRDTDKQFVLGHNKIKIKI